MSLKILFGYMTTLCVAFSLAAANVPLPLVIMFALVGLLGADAFMRKDLNW